MAFVMMVLDARILRRLDEARSRYDAASSPAGAARPISRNQQ